MAWHASGKLKNRFRFEVSCLVRFDLSNLLHNMGNNHKENSNTRNLMFQIPHAWAFGGIEYFGSVFFYRTVICYHPR